MNMDLCMFLLGKFFSLFGIMETFKKMLQWAAG